MKAMNQAGTLLPTPTKPAEDSILAAQESSDDKGKLHEKMPNCVFPTQAIASSNMVERTNSTADSIGSQLKELLANLSGLYAKDIRDNSELVDIGVDSLIVMELVREIEGMFTCTVRSSDLQGLQDFRSMVSFIE